MPSFRNLSVTVYSTASCGARVFGGIAGAIASNENKDAVYVGLMREILRESSRAIWATFDALTADDFWEEAGRSGRNGGHAGRVHSSCSIEEMMQTLKRLFPEYVHCGEEQSALNPNSGNPIACYYIRTSLPPANDERPNYKELVNKLDEWLRDNPAVPPAQNTVTPGASELLEQLLQVAGEL